MASYQGPGSNNPVYDTSQSVEVQIEDTDVEVSAIEENQLSMERERSQSMDTLLDIVCVSTDANSIQDENDAVLIDDGRMPCSDDTVIDLNIDSEALLFVNIFLLITLQRIPRHYSNRTKTVLTICQVFIVLGMFVAVAYDLGLFPGANTLTINKRDDLVTTVKNVISNAKFPLLYVVGIFYFRSRHLEKMLSEIRLTKRYWKYARKILIIMTIAVFGLTVLIPATSNTAQMSFVNKASPNESYSNTTIVINCSLSFVVRSMSLPIVLAFILVVYLLYCQVRLFKEQIQKWPLECRSMARNSYIDICRQIRNAERAFQPFLIVHFTIFLFLLIPLTISCVEQYEQMGRYSKVTTSSDSFPLKAPHVMEMAPTEAVDVQKQPVAAYNPVNGKTLGTSSGNQTKSAMDAFNDKKKVTKQWYDDPKGIIKVCLMLLGDVFEALALFGLPVIMIGKVEKCLKAIRDAIRMLKFDEQKETFYMFQNEKDIGSWDSILNDVRGIQLMGFNLASFRAALLMLLFPFVTTVFRYMLKHVNISP